MSYFYEKYESLCIEKGVSPSGAAKAVGLSNAAASGWADGSIPRQTTIRKIAAYFGVSVDYFKEGNGQKENPAAQEGNGVSDRDIRLLEWFHSLPEEKRKAILSLGGAPEDLV